MIRADLLVHDLAEAATLGRGPRPRRGAAMEELSRIADPAIAVDRGRVVWIGRERGWRRAVRLRPGARTVAGGGGTLVPAFVDAHTHAIFAGDRTAELVEAVRGRTTYVRTARRGGGIYTTVRATRRASDAAILHATEARLRAMAGSGTASVEVKSGYALTPSGELRLLRMIPRLGRRTGLELVPTFLGAHAIAPEYRRRPRAYVDRLVRTMLPAVARLGLARFCDVFCEPGFFSVAEAERILRAAAALGLGLKVHADEFVLSGGARLAARLGARSAEHVLATGPEDRERLARAGVTAVLLPLTALASAAGRRSPGRELVDAGVPVALGTDCSPATWVESMPLVVSAAVHAARMTPAEALTAATVNAAHASGLERAGTVEVGGPADFSVFPVPSAEGLGYRFDVRPTLVFRQGKPVSPA